MLQTSPYPRIHSMKDSSQRKRGEIQVILGPMFSGKTTELLRRLRRYHLAAYQCVVVKYSKDCRYSANDVATHDGTMFPAVSAFELKNIEEDVYQKCDVVGIDEGQFFPDLVQFCEQLANSGKTVIVAALDGDYMRKGFGDVLSLIPLAESIVKLTAVCMRCFGEAAFTYRTSADKEIEVIGGSEKYIAACRSCYNAGSIDCSIGKRKRKVLEAHQTTADDNCNQICAKKASPGDVTTSVESECENKEN